MKEFLKCLFRVKEYTGTRLVIDISKTEGRLYKNNVLMETYILGSRQGVYLEWDTIVEYT